MRHGTWREVGALARARRARGRGRVGLAAAILLAGILATVRAHADPIDPEVITDTDTLGREIRAQVRVVTGARERARQLRKELTTARDAYLKQVAAVAPGRRKIDEVAAKIAAIDHLLFLRALPDALRPRIARIGEYVAWLKKEHARGNYTPARSREASAAYVADTEKLLRDLGALRARVVKALETLRPPSFVPDGETVEAYRAKAVAERARLARVQKPVEAELARREATLRAAIAAVRSQDRTLAGAIQRYQRLLAVLHRRFAPPHVTEVKLSAPLDPTAADAPLYHAVVKEPAELRRIDRKLALLVPLLPTARRRAAEARAVLVDAGIGVASDGGAPPAVLFEAGWRLAEAIGGDARVAEPALRAELLAYRRRVSKQLTPRGAPAGPPRGERILAGAESLRRDGESVRMLAATAEDILDDQLGEALKGGAGSSFGLLAERFAESALKSGQALEGRRLGKAMTVAAFHPDLTVSKFKKLAEVADETLFAKLDRVLAEGAADRADGLVKKLRDPGTYDDLVKGFAVSALVTAGKDVVKNEVGYANDRAKLMAEMAVLDIEWFARRAEFQSASHFYRQCRAMLAGYQAKIGELFEKRASFPSRTVEVVANRPFSRFDQIRGEVTFSHPVTDVKVSVGDRRPSVKVDGATATFLFPANTAAAGEVKIAIVACRPGESPVALDGDPRTVVRYAGPTPASPERRGDLLAGDEPGPDRVHSFRVADAVLELVDSDADRGYVPGDWIGVRLRLPGSLPHQGLRLLTVPGDPKVEIPVPPAADGRVQIRVPKTGCGRLVVVAGPRGELEKYVQVAETKVSVHLPVVRDRPGGPFTKVRQVALPTHGRWLRPSREPIPDGRGRLVFEMRDAARQLAGFAVKVRLAGSRTVLHAGEMNEVDVKPGVYDVELGTIVPSVVRSVTVAAGNATVVRSAPTGRLEMPADDALGAPIASILRTVRRASDDGVVYAGPDASVDLPPGEYRLELGYAVPVKQGAFRVDAGRSTRVHAGGYGRFRVRAFDALGKEVASVVRTIRRKSDGKVVFNGAYEEADLPPGRYEVTIRYPVPMVFDDQVLAAGKVTTVTGGGLGRLKVIATNEKGRPDTRRFAVYRGDEELTGVFGGGTIDLPPGRYVLKYHQDGDVLERTVSVTRGVVTPVEVRVR